MKNIKNIPWEWLSVVVIVLAALCWYLVALDKVPLGIDEVSPGYNAYSLLLTGRDEFGKNWPISMRFNGTYSPPLYTYLSIPMIKIFGLNVLAVRMVSVVSGVLGIVVLYLLYKQLKIGDQLGVVFCLVVMMISPWMMLYTHSGYEGTLPLVIFELAVLLSWIGLKKPWVMMISIWLLSFAIYSSYTNKILSPLYVLWLFICFRQQIWKRENIKFLIFGIVGAVLIQIPNLSIVGSKSFWIKGSISFGENLLIEYHSKTYWLPGWLVLLYMFVREFAAQYLTYFSPRSLFWDGDPLLFRSIPGLSVLYPWMIIPIAMGFWELWKTRVELRTRFIWLLVVLSPVPAAMTKDPFWTYRAIPLLLPLMLVFGIGIMRIRRMNIRLMGVLGVILVVFSLVQLWEGWFVFLPHERAKDWQYGFAQLAKEIVAEPSQEFVIDNSANEMSYLEVAFFMQLSPEVLQMSVDPTIKNDYYNNIKFKPDIAYKNVSFRAVNWKNDVYKKQILVGGELAFSSDQVKEHALEKVFEIRYPMGKIAFVGYRTNPETKCKTDYQKSGILNTRCAN